VVVHPFFVQKTAEGKVCVHMSSLFPQTAGCEEYSATACLPICKNSLHFSVIRFKILRVPCVLDQKTGTYKLAFEKSTSYASELHVPSNTFHHLRCLLCIWLRAELQGTTVVLLQSSLRSHWRGMTLDQIRPAHSDVSEGVFLLPGIEL
jgi:hypothetical protein